MCVVIRKAFVWSKVTFYRLVKDARGYEMENNSTVVNTKMHRWTHCGCTVGAVQG